MSKEFTVLRSSPKFVLNKDGELVQFNDNFPSFEFNEDGTYKGMLVEETRYNEIRNSTGTGSTEGVIGSNGVLPTNWGTASLNGIGVEVIDTGIEKGVEYVDIKFSGTATDSASFGVRFESGTHITAAQNEIWSCSVYMKYIDQTANPDRVRLGVAEFDSSAIQVGGDVDEITLTSTLTRFKNENIKLTGANGATATVNEGVFFTITDGQTYDFTVRFGLPQLEKGDVVTSVIKTTNIKEERDKDVITMDDSAEYLPSEGRIIMGWEQLKDDTIYIGETSALVNKGKRKLEYIYSSTRQELIIDGDTKEVVNGSYDFSGMNKVQLGHINGTGQPNTHIYYFAIL